MKILFPFIKDIDELTQSEFENYISEKPLEKKQTVLSYLKRFDICAHTTQPVFDKITGEKVLDADNARSDGLYTWYESEIYHFEKYNYMISPDFVEHVLSIINRSR